MTIYILLPNLEPVCCPMSSSNCCFLTCIQVSQEAGQVVWYSHLFQNFPQFIDIHTVNGFVRINKAEIVVFLELSFFFYYPANVGNLISGSSVFSKTIDNFWLFYVYASLFMFFLVSYAIMERILGKQCNFYYVISKTYNFYFFFFSLIISSENNSFYNLIENLSWPDNLNNHLRNISHLLNWMSVHT